MLNQEIKQTIDSLDQDELIYAEAYIKAKNLASEQTYRDQIGNTLKEMKNGKSISSKNLREISNFMDEKGL
jgi:hypothetical protein